MPERDGSRLQDRDRHLMGPRLERVLVTGGFGFLGRHLLETLTRGSPELAVTAVDLQPAPARALPGVRYVGGVDILDPRSIRAAVAGYDAVIHLAGLVSFRYADRHRLFEVNQVGTRNVAQACATEGVGRLIHVSSVAALGFNDREDEPADEALRFDWRRGKNKHYMLSKRAAEGELAHASAAGVAVAIANPGLMYGPSNRMNLQLFRAIRAGRLSLLPPGGTNVVDVRDVAVGLRLLLLTGARDEQFILGGHNLRLSEVLRTIARVLGAPLAARRISRRLHRPFHMAAMAGERALSSKLPLTSDNVDSAFRFRYFSSGKAARVLGWRARIPFARSVADEVDELRAEAALEGAG